ncbi:MAG: endonuclease/exonuclease/phosphatase family protein, partial [Flavitalea sp.]
MAPVFRRITKRVFIIITIILAAIFLLACCNSFLHPQEWWFIALLGLTFPFLLLIMAGLLIFWIIFRSKWALLPLAVLAIGYTNIRALVGFNIGKTFNETKRTGAMRIMTWNVTWFDEQTKADKSRVTYRQKMLDFISSQNVDVVCFQEYLEPNSKRRDYNNEQALTKLGYPYHFIATDYIGWKGTFQTGIAIFSKYPIADTFHVRYPGPVSLKAAESLISADININGKIIRVFTTHLQSVLFQKT